VQLAVATSTATRLGPGLSDRWAMVAYPDGVHAVFCSAWGRIRGLVCANVDGNIWATSSVAQQCWWTRISSSVVQAD
jgi:hypothetical protein